MHVDNKLCKEKCEICLKKAYEYLDNKAKIWVDFEEFLQDVSEGNRQSSVVFESSTTEEWKNSKDDSWMEK